MLGDLSESLLFAAYITAARGCLELVHHTNSSQRSIRRGQISSEELIAKIASGLGKHISMVHSYSYHLEKLDKSNDVAIRRTRAEKWRSLSFGAGLVRTWRMSLAPQAWVDMGRHEQS